MRLVGAFRGLHTLTGNIERNIARYLFYHFEIQVWPTVFCDIQTIQISASYSTLLLWKTQLLSHSSINYYLYFENYESKNIWKESGQVYDCIIWTWAGYVHLGWGLSVSVPFAYSYQSSLHTAYWEIFKNFSTSRILRTFVALLILDNPNTRPSSPPSHSNST